MLGFSNMIKRWDIIITLLLVLLSFLPVAIFSYQQAGKMSGVESDNSVNVAVISVNNEKVRRVTLTGNEGTDVFDIHSSAHDYNTVEVKDEQIRIKGANCSDQVCVQFGFLSKPGETAVCLPHKFIIEIETVRGEIDDDLIISS
ncbi:NusG domain II-containing protein [Bacillus sp. V3B]|uniref:NusG domain II-containing protein n=1 Tax=Bacillus sp. V3B TaxID=2804915 RepID=UPI00210E100F|nr:NusG domain II-containing protein [Bacillus sp. V3B]MCQ6274516.1 NusG domain II-containing protein [Bacillus sp. V3B]